MALLFQYLWRVLCIFWWSWIVPRQKEGDGDGIILATMLLWMSLKSVEGMSPCEQTLASKASSITMPPLVPTTPPVSTHSWTHYMISLFQPVNGDHKIPGILSSGTMWVLVHQPPIIYCSISPILFHITWKDFLSIVIEGLWLQSSCPHASSSGNKRCMW